MWRFIVSIWRGGPAERDDLIKFLSHFDTRETINYTRKLQLFNDTCPTIEIPHHIHHLSRLIVQLSISTSLGRGSSNKVFPNNIQLELSFALLVGS